MHIVENTSKSKCGKKIYQSVLMRESYREDGKVKKRTVANLSHCSPEEITAIKLALKHKEDLTLLGSLKESTELQEGMSVGAVWTVYQVARELGIEKALGTEFQGKLALWQIIARVIDQGSRLSAVRLAQTHAACDVLGLRRGFDENNLYENLKWLTNNQKRIERNLFANRKDKRQPQLFLYDVTSTYLEGENNHFAAFGYNRDKKKGKKQIVIGLLCDESGDPVSVEVFDGNTQDTKTFASQVVKVAEEFGCKNVTMVGDRGMIKSTQIKNLPECFHYITAITKAQIGALMKKNVFQIGLFDTEVCEVSHDGIRYVLRLNPTRAREIQDVRSSKKNAISDLIKKKNTYLREHPGAKVLVAKNEVKEKITRLKVNKWLKVTFKKRTLQLKVDDAALKEESLLDGCYVIKTDLSDAVADKQTIHDRYKDLALVEKAFRDCKTVVLEVRPVYVRNKASTCGHVSVVMLAYKIIRRLRKAWEEMDVTVEEGLKQLATVCSTELIVKGQGSCLKIPRPREMSRNLLNALNIRMPMALPHLDTIVVTRKKLMGQRKSLEKSRDSC